MGWLLAKPRSQDGIDCTGTNADDAKVNGKSSGKAMSCAASAFGAIMPTTENPHDRAYAKSSKTPTAPTKAKGDV